MPKTPKPVFRRSRPGDPSWPSAAQWAELDAESGRAARPGALAARGLPQRARERRVRGGLPRPQEPLVHRRQCRAHPDQRLGRCLDVGAQRLCRRRAQHRRRGGGGRLRAHAPAAAGGEGRRPQLPGHVERGRLAAGLDAADGSHRACTTPSSARAAATPRSRRCRSAPARSGCTPMPPSPRLAATCRAAAASPWAWRAWSRAAASAASPSATARRPPA